MQKKQKATKRGLLIFPGILFSFFIACQDPGTIGSKFVEKTKIDIDTLLLTDINTISADPYLGKLDRSAVGGFEDPLFGNLRAVSFFKPSITKASNTLPLVDEARFLLNLQLFPDEVYGDSTSEAEYSIYRATSLWRGSAFKQSMDINYDATELIGEFNDASFDTNGIAKIELTGSWVKDYINYFNMPDLTRNDFYRENEFGLVIVPNAESEKIIYTSYASSVLQSIVPDTTSFDTTARNILDWGYDLETLPTSTDADRIRLESTLNAVIQVNLAQYTDQIESINFVRTELVFSVDTTSIVSSIAPNVQRTDPLGLGLKLGPLTDVAYELFFETNDASAVIQNGAYRIDITDELNAYLVGELELSDAYIFLIGAEGALSYTNLFSENSEREFTPQIIFYGLEGEF